MQTTSRYASRTSASLGEGYSFIALRFGTCRVYSFYIECQFVPAKFIKSSSRPYDFRTQATLCHLFVIDNKTTALPVKQLDSVTGSIVENVDSTIRRIEVIAAYQLGQAKNTLTHIHGSATNPKNICFVEYKHKFFGQR